MASPIPTAKQSVKLSSPVRVSRIRRDPPPVVKEKILRDPESDEQWTVVIGVVTFALALFVVFFGFANYSGWSPGQYKVELHASE